MSKIVRNYGVVLWRGKDYNVGWSQDSVVGFYVVAPESLVPTKTWLYKPIMCRGVYALASPSMMNDHITPAPLPKYKWTEWMITLNHKEL